MGRVKIFCSYSFFAVLYILLVLDKSGFLIWYIISALMHEAGHMAVILLAGGKITRVDLTKRGIYIGYGDENLTFSRKMWVLLAGCGVNLITAAVIFIFFDDRFIKLGITSLLLGIYNLLPIEGLDGGSILEEIKLRRI